MGRPGPPGPLWQRLGLGRSLKRPLWGFGSVAGNPKRVEAAGSEASLLRHIAFVYIKS